MAMTLTRSKSAGKRPPKQFERWSFSRWRDWKQCPYRAKLKHLDKVPEGDPGPALARGTAVHESLDSYLTGRTKTMPTEAKQLKKEYTALKALGTRTLQVEQSWGFTSAWQPCAWNDWAKVWLIVKQDVVYLTDAARLTAAQLKAAGLKAKDAMLGIDDHKTGKVKLEENELQLELYSVTGLVKEPDVAGTHARLLFVDHGEVAEMVTPRRDQAKLLKLWDGRVRPMMADTNFAMKPGNYCTWCPYSKTKGGTCKF